MTRNGTAYQLQPLARPTGVIGSGSWPTPDASVAQDGEKPDTWLARREREKLKGQNGNGMGMPLTIAVQIWPTPTKTDAEKGYASPPGTTNDRGRQTLSGAVQWATPKAHPSGPDYAKATRPNSGGDDLATQVARRENGGALNPTWVEWLMGFPTGWTDLGASATPSCPKSQSGSDGES